MAKVIFATEDLLEFRLSYSTTFVYKASLVLPTMAALGEILGNLSYDDTVGKLVKVNLGKYYVKIIFCLHY